MMDELLSTMNVRFLKLNYHGVNFFDKRRPNNTDTQMEPFQRFHTTVDGVAVRKIFVANLPLKVTNADLLTKFQTYGKIQNATVVPATSLRPSSFGFVTFYSPYDASRAIEKKLFLQGRKLFLSAADSWHQPKELPDGTIIWDTRPFQNKQVCSENQDAEEEEDEEEDADNEGEEECAVINDEVTCPISKLNDDCLHLIFGYLEINERVIVGHVCRRWRKVNETMWLGIRKLDFSTLPLSRVILNNDVLQLYLSLCPNVTVLNVATPEHHTLNSGAIVTIAKSCRLLEELTIKNIPIQRRSLALLAQNCPNLVAFYMSVCANHHDCEMITLVKKCKKLKKIGLKFSSSLSGAWLKHLRCPLQSLSLEMYEMNPDYLLQGISKVHSTLKELSFICCPAIRCSDIGTIAEMVPNLTYLTLAGMFSLIRLNALLPITKLKNLIRLDLEQNSVVCDNFMENLVENCSSLMHLNLSGTDHSYNLTEKGLTLVARLTNLTHLRIACHDGLNDNILKTLSNKLKNLKHLDLTGCQKITDEGCIEIINNCTQLESLNVSRCNITNTTMLAAIELAENGCKRKIHIIAGGTRVDPDELIIKPEIRPYINIDIQTIISQLDEFYDSDNDNSDLSLDDYDIYDDEAGYYDFFDSDEDDDFHYSDYDAAGWFFHI
ncbi:putative RNA-binding protein EEED8.10 isoform X3 [Rhodnius prolixus]